ncbi:hypothetical protein E2C01_100896 [Portunus trituberculatus]|uniref:Uncharacterized protein n=1 Tax=Portunus trituberculatus TaxID=210409 RepID=A0A5B7KKM9_PORTR|nr:hypothetical protein [Portunus trituberculatus]
MSACKEKHSSLYIQVHDQYPDVCLCVLATLPAIRGPALQLAAEEALAKTRVCMLWSQVFVGLIIVQRLMTDAS